LPTVPVKNDVPLPVFAFASNNVDATSAQTVGMVLSTSIANNQKGLIIVNGQLDGLSLFPTSTWADGDAVYLGATAGTVTNVKPYAPNHLVYLGFVTTASNGSAGRMYVRVQNGYEMQELHNVSAQTPANDDILKYNTTTSLWETSNALSTKQDTITGAASTITSSNLTGSRALVSDGGGKVASSAVTTTELGRLVGVTSDIQTQLNAKANTGSGTSFLTGTVGNANTSVGAGATNYLGLTGSGLTISENIRVTVFPQDCTLSRLYFGTSTTQPATGSLVLTLRKNNADTALVITIAAGTAGGFFNDTTNSVSFTAGQYASIKFQNFASAASAQANAIALMVTI